MIGYKSQGGFFMKRSNLSISVFIFSLFFLTPHLSASVIAIIDSGSDMEHVAIAPQAWVNPVDIPSGRDEDGNGYPDDIHGWNFAEGNNEVIDYSYLGLLNDDIRRFFDIQTLLMLGQASDEDIAWIRAKIQDQDFVRDITVYGNFMHGTHVGGIAVEQTDKSKMMAIKLIPTEVDLPFFTNEIFKELETNKALNSDKSFRVGLVKRALGLLAREQSKLMVEIGDYLDGHEVDVANGSFGTGYAQASMIVEGIFEGIFRRPPTDEELYEVSSHFINTLVDYVGEMADIAPDTLYVFAAGNDGTDNDIFPVSPSNIQRDNVLSVAATIDRIAIAPFSNYGIQTVDVAAPGFSIHGPVPGDKYLSVSGTSQAAPYVAGVASEVKAINPSLSPLQVRQIIEGTVDVKDFLASKVATSGIVNHLRAIEAARISNERYLTEAISIAHQRVDDLTPSAEMSSDLKSFDAIPFIDGIVPSLPSPIVLEK